MPKYRLPQNIRNILKQKSSASSRSDVVPNASADVREYIREKSIILADKMLSHKIDLHFFSTKVHGVVYYIQLKMLKQSTKLMDKRLYHDTTWEVFGNLVFEPNKEFNTLELRNVDLGRVKDEAYVAELAGQIHQDPAEL